MKRLFVGQRVRVNCPGSTRHRQETTIIALGVPAQSEGFLYVGAQVNLTVETGITIGSMCVFEYHELEPIIDPGRQLVEWSECLWQPKSELA